MTIISFPHSYKKNHNRRIKRTFNLFFFRKKKKSFPEKQISYRFNRQFAHVYIDRRGSVRSLGCLLCYLLQQLDKLIKIACVAKSFENLNHF